MSDSGDVKKLVQSAQSGLDAAMPLTTAAKRRDLIAAAQCQADCANAVATQHQALALEYLADAVWALVDPEEQEET